MENKVFLLGANREIDRNKQVVEVYQIIQMQGYSYHRYVVYEIEKTKWGVVYKLIDLTTKEFNRATIVQPLSQEFGIGFYWDDSQEPQFMDAFEVEILKQEAQQKKKAEEEEAEKERTRVEEVKKIGRKRFTEIFPENAQAIIVARLKQDESDSQTDYFASSTQRTVILGFSTHKRDIFSEMRKHAYNFKETTYLAEYNEDYEHREKYSMGDGYYLGESKYHGWIIEKVPVCKRENTIEEFAYTAGNEDNIQLKNNSKVQIDITEEKIAGKFTIVDYSDKAIAIFGDTRPIKEQLKALGGRFNPKLNHNGEKKAGWIFQKSKKNQVRQLLGINE